MDDYSRIERLLTARKKLEARIAAGGPEEKLDAWAARLEEYDQSIRNFQEHGRETVTTSPVQVDIDVPKGTFEIKAKI